MLFLMTHTLCKKTGTSSQLPKLEATAHAILIQMTRNMKAFTICELGLQPNRYNNWKKKFHRLRVEGRKDTAHNIFPINQIPILKAQLQLRSYFKRKKIVFYLDLHYQGQHSRKFIQWDLLGKECNELIFHLHSMCA